MTRLLYKSNGKGLLVAKQLIPLKDGRKVTVFIDENELEYNIVNIADTKVLGGGNAINLREVKYAARRMLLELGADLGIEVKSPIKKAQKLVTVDTVMGAAKEYSKLINEDYGKTSSSGGSQPIQEK